MFCANKKCKWHVPGTGKPHLTVVTGRDQDIKVNSSRPGVERLPTIQTETRNHWSWRDPAFGGFYLCDVCNEAANMIAKMMNPDRW